jgi:tetratricopeptide (TPR) repeat protein
MGSPRSAVTARIAVRRTRSDIRRLRGGETDAQTLSELGEAHLELAEYLARLERFTEAVGEFDAAFAALSQAGHPAQAARVRVRSAGVLMVLGRQAEALEAVDEVINTGARVEDAAEVMPMAYLWRVIALQELDRPQEALTKARRLIKRFGPGSSDFQRQVVAKALLLESDLALENGDQVGAIRAAKQILARYGVEARSGAGALQDTVTAARRRLANLPSD